MTVEDLIKRLEKYPKDAKVFVHTEHSEINEDGSSFYVDEIAEPLAIGKNKKGTEVVISGAGYPSLYTDSSHWRKSRQNITIVEE